MNFNKAEKNTNKTTSYEGGAVYNKAVEEDWLNMLFSMRFEDCFYESADTQMERFFQKTAEMVDMYGYSFISYATMFTRNYIGNRSASQLMAAFLNDKQFDNKRKFFKDFCHRADDVAETFAAIDTLGQKRSHAAVRGFGDYLSGLNAYAIDKYKMNGKKYNLFDCINITHANSEAINAFKRDMLEKANTWEQTISATDDKAASWSELVMSHKLGYLALLRNIRNIASEVYDRDVIKSLCEQLVNEDAIEKSLVYPYQIFSAYKALVKADITSFDIMYALEKAFRTSVKNMPVLNSDNNCVILDVSGSMDDRISGKSDITIKECGAVYGIAILLANPETTLIKFGNHAKLFKANINKNAFDLISSFCKNDNCGYGTDIAPAFNMLDKHYDRIFIISDMQVMANIYSGWSNSAVRGMNAYDKYTKNFGNTNCYSFDLGNYATTVANPNKPGVHLLTTLSPQIFKMINVIDSGESIHDFIMAHYR